MNIKDPLNPYEDTRKKDDSLRVKRLIEQKAVYKCNYELVMGHAPAKCSNMGYSAPKSYTVTRRSGATVNGITI